MIYTSIEVGPKLLEVFGLSAKDVRRFSIVCDVNEMVKLNVEYIGELNEELNELETIIKTFELVEK